MMASISSTSLSQLLIPASFVFNSKRRFQEQQAEVWWKENKDRLLKKYSPPTINVSLVGGPSTPVGSSSTPAPTEVNVAGPPETQFQKVVFRGTKQKVERRIKELLFNHFINNPLVVSALVIKKKHQRRNLLFFLPSEI